MKLGVVRTPPRAEGHQSRYPRAVLWQWGLPCWNLEPETFSQLDNLWRWSRGLMANDDERKE